MNHSVAIVGAGPTGLMLACELGLAGIDTVVLERLPEPRTGSWGIGLHARTVDALALRGLAERLSIDTAPVWPRIHFGLFWLDLTGMIDREYTLMLPQWQTERVLAERAAELGADIRRGHEVTGMDQDADGVTIDVRTPTGDTRIRCQYVIGCDGGNGTVAELAGFTFDSLGNDTSYYGVLGDAQVPPGFHDHFRAGIYPNGLFAAIPLPSGETRLMCIEFDGKAPDRDEPVTVGELAASIQRVTGNDGPLGETSWLGRCGNPTRAAEQYRIGRVFLAGDAAHAHLPAATHGLNTGVHDALNLGWKLAAELHGWAPPGLLDTYHTERHPVGRRACVNSLAQQTLMHPIDEVGPLRELFGELVGYDSVTTYLVQMLTTVHYPMGHKEETTHPLVGQPIVDGPLETANGTTSNTHALYTGRGVILAPTGHTPDISGWTDRVDLIAFQPTKENPGVTILIRPDGYIASAGTGHKGLHDALTTWFGPPNGDLSGVTRPM